MKRCILLLIDGLHPDVGERALREGQLPNVARLVRGGGVTRAITAFPSTTSVSYLPFLTGCLPGRCDVPSIRWMDRTGYHGRWWADRRAIRSYCGYQAAMLDDDIRPEVRTLFELIPESAAFFLMVAKGLTAERDPARAARRFWGAVSHYSLWHQPGDDVVTRHLLDWIDRDTSWRFLFAQFPAVDGYTHQTSPDSAPVLRALSRVDRTIGSVTRALDRDGIAEDTLVLVVSDHGASRVRHHLDLAEWFRRRGVRTLAHPELWRRAPSAAVMVAGNGSAMVYARPATARPSRWPMERLRGSDAFGSREDLIAALVAEPAVAFVAAEDAPGTIRIADHEGEALVHVQGRTIHYQPHTADPLRIGGSTRLDPRAWLELTFDHPFPDAPVQLVDQFRSGRTGDLLVVARKGFDLRARWEIPEHKSGHGSMIRDHMQTPLWSSHPIGSARMRTADVFASILSWLDHPLPAGIDGEPVWRPADRAAVAEGESEMHYSAPTRRARSSAG